MRSLGPFAVVAPHFEPRYARRGRHVEARCRRAGGRVLHDLGELERTR